MEPNPSPSSKSSSASLYTLELESLSLSGWLTPFSPYDLLFFFGFDTSGSSSTDFLGYSSGLSYSSRLALPFSGSGVAG
jgi:hypothetical protein